MNISPLNPNRWFLLVGLIPWLAACGADRELVGEKDPGVELPIVRVGESDSSLPWSDVGLSLEITRRDSRNVPQEIRVTFVNNSAKRGRLALPRPVVEGVDYAESLPCLCVGVRDVAELDDLTPKELAYLYTLPRGRSAGELMGVDLEPGAKFARRYELSSFCAIGHGIAAKAAANFSTMYRAGDEANELRVYVITDWNKLTRIESNPAAARLSEADFSVREKLGE